MHTADKYRERSNDAAHGVVSYVLLVFLVIALGLVGAIALGSPRAPRAPAPASSPATPVAARFILDALLVTALERDAVPLRWVDPRPALRCGPDTEVRVNGKPLAAGTLVPVMPFDLEWRTNGCRLGAHGPRFDGRVK